MRKSFVFYISYYEAIKELPEEYQIEMLDAIMEYVIEDKEPTDKSAIVRAVFRVMKPNIDNSIKNHNTSVENGKKGGRPKKIVNDSCVDGLLETKKNLKKPKITQNNLKKPNQNLNVDVDVNVDVDDDITTAVVNNAGDSCNDGLQKIAEFYNQNIGLLTPYRIRGFRKLRTRNGA